MPNFFSNKNLFQLKTVLNSSYHSLIGDIQSPLLLKMLHLPGSKLIFDAVHPHINH
jgi:hypothetical protein